MGTLPTWIQEAARGYATALKAKFGAKLLDVRVFGSYARGEASPSSDLDVFVLLEGMTTADKRDAIDLASDLTLAHDLTALISPHVMDRTFFEKLLHQERRLALDITNEGIRV